MRAWFFETRRTLQIKWWWWWWWRRCSM